MKFGLVGAGRMGQLHLSKLLHLPGIELIGICDPKGSPIDSVPLFENYQALLFEVDAMVIASSTASHFELAKQALEQGVHVLVEKPMCETVFQAEQLVELARSQKLCLQVGFLERFRLKRLTGEKQMGPIRALHTVRHATSLPRENGIDIVSDMMVHDLDLVIGLINQEPVVEFAMGGNTVSPYLDFADVRLHFPNGVVANLNVQRAVPKQQRTFHIETPDHRYEFDLLNGQMDPLKEQLEEFVLAIREGRKPLVTGEDGVRVMKLTDKILSQILQNHRYSPHGAEVFNQ